MSTHPSLYEAIDELTAVDGLFEIVDKDIDGVTYEVFKHQPVSLRDLFALLPSHGDKVFLVYKSDRFTYRQTWESACAFAHALQDDLGIEKGDRVAIAMRNLPEWIISYIAITSIGAVVVPMNSWGTRKELAYGLADSGAKVVVADPRRMEMIRTADIEVTCVLVREHADSDDVLGFGDLLAKHHGKDLPEVTIDSDADVSIMYTSGSTGEPKGAVATHRGILSAIMSWALLGKAASMERGEEAIPSTQQTATLMTVPLFHVTGCNSLFLLSVLTGRKIVMMHKWDVQDALALIEKEKITYFNGVPTMSRELQVAAATSDRDISSLQELFAGGAARPPQHVTDLAEAFPKSVFGVGYGLTETCGIGTVNSGSRYTERPASAGKVTPPVTELKIIDPDGNDQPAGEAGEICIKGPVNVRCYWNRPEETAASFQNGWFRTGDVGYLDEEGYLFVVDRLKDIIIRGGENISCIEVEAAIYEHDAVAEAAVFGVPDERLGELVFAVVTARDSKNVAAEQLQSFVGERLAAFKVPAHVSVLHETLPRTGTGKIFKRQIRDLVVKTLTPDN